MASGVTHLFQIFVLPAGPNTLLAGHRKLVGPELQALEDALELDHPGVGEQQGELPPGPDGRPHHLRDPPRLEAQQAPPPEARPGEGRRGLPPPRAAPPRRPPPPPD